METMVEFPGGARVLAHFDGFTVETDLPPEAGGEGAAPTPFDTFLAALATCAGIYVVGFCRQRGIPVEGIRMIQHVEYHAKTDMAERISLDIQLPTDFPEAYKAAVIRVASQCKIKKQFEAPPEFVITTSVRGK